MPDKLQTAMPPASEPFPGSRTPGWNDPPTLAYNPLSSTSSGGPGRPRINLNKRVSYPLQGTAAPISSKPTAVVLPNQSGACLPPPSISATSLQPVAVVHPMPHTSSAQQNILLPTNAATLSFRCLREQVHLVEESINVRREEIERRLDIIEQLWQTGNISTAVQQEIYRLSDAVSRRSYNEAMEIYTSPVANHASECNSWAVTLRHIILTIPANTVSTSGTELVNSSTASNTISNAAIPTMSVSAMPRSSTEHIVLSSSNSTASTITSRVQHI